MPKPDKYKLKDQRYKLTKDSRKTESTNKNTKPVNDVKPTEPDSMEIIYKMTNYKTYSLFGINKLKRYKVDIKNFKVDRIYVFNIEDSDKIDNITNKYEYIVNNLKNAKILTLAEYLELYGHIDDSKRPCCQCYSNADNLLSNNLFNLIPYMQDKIQTSIAISHDEIMPGIINVSNIIPVDLATKVRTFINSIPLCQTIPKLNDTSNLPKTIVNYEMYHLIKNNNLNVYKTMDSMPLLWTYEKYSLYFHRLCPLSVNGLINSPIYVLIHNLHQMFLKSNLFGLDFSKLIPSTFVIQKICKDYDCPEHYDGYYQGPAFHRRVFSFIYYITPDDYDANDGGILRIYDDSENVILNVVPKFNSLICWHLKANKEKYPDISLDPGVKGPLHDVTTVLSDKPRLALVGFYVGLD